MRRLPQVLAALLPALLLAGCAMNPSGSLSPSAATSSAGVASTLHLTGKTFGGQRPVANAHYLLYRIGKTGYGSTGTLLAQTDGDSSGNFNFTNSITCNPSIDSLYLLSVGGDAGFGTNSAIVEGVGLGDCTAALNATVNITENTTVAMAYAFAQFFTATGSSNGYSTDFFGEPGTSTALDTAGQYTLPLLVSETNGYPVPSTATIKTEADKLQSLGNLLGYCVNSVPGATGTNCATLFSQTASSTLTPANTLEAAVNIALHPGNNVSALFTDIPTGATSAFGGGLGAAPADWSLAIAYTNPNAALNPTVPNINGGTAATIDIDTTGKVWFPSNLAGKAGIAYFDPVTASFSATKSSASTPYVSPNQVVIDLANYVWASDPGSTNVPFYMIGSTSFGSSSLPYPSTSVSPNKDLGVSFGMSMTGGDYQAGIAYAHNVNNFEYTYTGVANSSYTPALASGSNNSGSALFVSQDSASGRVDSLVPNTPPTPDTLQQRNPYSGLATGVAETGFGTFPYFFATDAHNTVGSDAICTGGLTSAVACATFTPPSGYTPSGPFTPMGVAIDGSGVLWIANSGNGSVSSLKSNGGYSNYFFNGTTVPVTMYVHDTSNGSTMPAPNALAIDTAGNVWTSNNGTQFVLTELIGAASPTIVPLAEQVVYNRTGSKP